MCIHEHLETGMRVDIKHLVLASAVECFLLLWRQGEEGDPTQDMSMLTWHSWRYLSQLRT